jgi:hypothetical protein
MPGAMFKGLCSFEIIYGYFPGDNPFDQLCSSIPQVSRDYIIQYAERKREVLEAMCGIIEEDYFKRQDQRWYQQITSGTRIADNVPISRYWFISIKEY